MHRGLIAMLFIWIGYNIIIELFMQLMPSDSVCVYIYILSSEANSIPQSIPHTCMSKTVSTTSNQIKCALGLACRDHVTGLALGQYEVQIFVFWVQLGHTLGHTIIYIIICVRALMGVEEVYSDHAYVYCFLQQEKQLNPPAS